ncbi:Hypothetical protein CAP_5881 [Chondromyces apiculatus DSM 436]|uniref:Uncharacterized protein n=1 Tax=Chondromyces apiculatus DSM 436 TaxID=1192034 RepID=A0A017THR1_9BACT|nr:Hypothetical protein CAP_5881 [Chondromyces apiculatus DSM 436]
MSGHAKPNLVDAKPNLVDAKPNRVDVKPIHVHVKPLRWRASRNSWHATCGSLPAQRIHRHPSRSQSSYSPLSTPPPDTHSPATIRSRLPMATDPHAVLEHLRVTLLTS